MFYVYFLEAPKAGRGCTSEAHAVSWRIHLAVELERCLCLQLYTQWGSFNLKKLCVFIYTIMVWTEHPYVWVSNCVLLDFPLVCFEKEMQVMVIDELVESLEGKTVYIPIAPTVAAA